MRDFFRRWFGAGSIFASPVVQGALCILWLLLCFGGRTMPAVAFASMLLLLGLVKFVECLVACLRAFVGLVAARRAGGVHAASSGASAASFLRAYSEEEG